MKHVFFSGRVATEHVFDGKMILLKILWFFVARGAEYIKTPMTLNRELVVRGATFDDFSLIVLSNKGVGLGV